MYLKYIYSAPVKFIFQDGGSVATSPRPEAVIILTFKDKSDWQRAANSRQWSSQSWNNENVSTAIWNEDGSGKTVEIKIKPNMLYKFIFANIGFKSEAFNEEPPEPSRSEPESRPPTLTELKGENEHIDIFIIGESNHTLVRPIKLRLIQQFITEGAYIFSEGIDNSENTRELDDYLASFRVAILFSSLYTKALHFLETNARTSQERSSIANMSHQASLKIAAMVLYILENDKEPNIHLLIQGWTQMQSNPSPNILRNPTILLFRQHIKTTVPVFDFQSIYYHYFGLQDNYRDDMMRLLSLDDVDAMILLTKGYRDERNGVAFYNITQEAREMEMVKRVIEHMSNPENIHKVVLFTGFRHLEKLNEELSNTYKVKTLILDQYGFRDDTHNSDTEDRTNEPQIES